MLDFFKSGGPFMVFLVLTSIVALAFIIERGLALRWAKVIPPEIEKALALSNAAPKTDGLQQACLANPSALSRLLLAALDHLNWDKEENTDALQTQARYEVLQLERGVVVLEIVVGIAPLLGLVGTIHGLIALFGDLGREGLANNLVVARGIGIALNTTLMGLLIAIPSLIAWSYFNKKIEQLAVEMERFCDEFMRLQYRRKKKPTA
jgi:biopolymer transport protein ExbB